MLKLSKRKRFIITSSILSLGFVGIQLLPDNFRFLSISLLGTLTIILFVWSLWEGLAIDLTLLTLVLPTYFTVAVGLFWFLLPTSIFARTPVILLFALGIYVLCLTSNIYTVAAIRNIALMRAARGVGFVLTLITFFLIFDTILSLRWPIYLMVAAVTLISIPLFIQAYWAIPLERKFTENLDKISLVSSLVVGEVAAALSFWPVTVVVGSLFLTVTAYMLLGLGQAELEERLFSQTIREYLVVGIAVFLGMFLVTSWGG